MRIKEMVKPCTMCGDISHVILFGNEVDFYEKKLQNLVKNEPIKLIQEELPDSENDVREYLKGAYCNTCMETLFNHPGSGRIQSGYDALLDELDITDIPVKSIKEGLTYYEQLVNEITELNRRYNDYSDEIKKKISRIITPDNHHGEPIIDQTEHIFVV